MEAITQWSATSWGVAALSVGYAYLLARAWLTDKRKANESHVRSVESMQQMLRDDLKIVRADFRALQGKLESLQSRHEVCVTKLAESMTRLELLEKFRTIAEDDGPTGRTLEAMPPPPEN